MAKMGRVRADLIHHSCGGVIKSCGIATIGGRIRMQAICQKCGATARYPKNLGCIESDVLADELEATKNPKRNKK